jgi:DtxR family transcriptional regulator, Mn-dependent transcriptional regulator
MSTSTEDYLKSLFTLQRIQTGAVKTSTIAAHMNVSSAAVSEMIKKLSVKKLLTYSPYHGVELTKEGVSQGRNMVRRHRILELFLHEVLGLPWDKVHQEAEQLEHASSDIVINKMEEILDFPKFDPHGDPIPAIDGTIPELTGADFLNQMTPGDRVEVVRVQNENEAFLVYIQSIGIKLGTVLEITEYLPFDQSLKVKIENKEVLLSLYSTKNLWVRHINLKKKTKGATKK